MWRASSAPGSIDAVSGVRASSAAAISFSGTHPVADGTTYQPVSLAGELGAIILEVHVTHEWRDARGEGHRILADRERIARVEDDADRVARLFGQSEEFFAAEVLVIFDRKRKSGVLGSRRFADERGPRVRHEPRPVGAPLAACAFEDGGEVHADQSSADGAGGPNVIGQRLAGNLREAAAVDRGRTERVNLLLRAGEFGVVRLDNPPAVDFDA